jgi:hypothetical protein
MQSKKVARSDGAEVCWETIVNMGFIPDHHHVRLQLDLPLFGAGDHDL